MAMNDYLKKILLSRVYDVAVETPLEQAEILSRRLDNVVLLKREDTQPVFSFKLRGAYNKMAQLSREELDRGVIAASAGNQYIGRALIGAGADVNAKNGSGSTPLILAARNGRNDFVSLLLESGADPDAADNDGRTAMHYASESGFTEIVEMLLTAGAKG